VVFVLFTYVCGTYVCINKTPLVVFWGHRHLHYKDFDHICSSRSSVWESFYPPIQARQEILRLIFPGKKSAFYLKLHLLWSDLELWSSLTSNAVSSLTAADVE